MNVAAQRIMRGRVREGVRPAPMVPFVLWLVALACSAMTAPAIAQEAGQCAASHLAVDPCTGREIYLPTGESVDLVIPVTAPRADSNARAALPTRANTGAALRTGYALAVGLGCLSALALGLWIVRAHGRQRHARRARPSLGATMR